jgi:hypothetical protein
MRNCSVETTYPSGRGEDLQPLAGRVARGWSKCQQARSAIGISRLDIEGDR